MIYKDNPTLLQLGKKLISDLTQELNDELEKVEIISDQQTKNDVIANCDGILAKINSRLDQIKSQLSDKH